MPPYSVNIHMFILTKWATIKADDSIVQRAPKAWGINLIKKNTSLASETSRLLIGYLIVLNPLLFTIIL